MGSRGPIPKRSDQRHGHRKAEPVTKGRSGFWGYDENGEPVYMPVAEHTRISYDVRLPPGIEFEVEFEEDES